MSCASKMEYSHQMARQESRPKNRKKRAARQNNRVEGKDQAVHKEGEVGVEEEEGEGVQQLWELNRGEVSQLRDSLEIFVKVSLQTFVSPSIKH